MKAGNALFATLAVLILQIAPVEAQSFSVKKYKMAVKGTSTLHDWESPVNSLEAKGSFTVSDNTLAELRDVVIRIPVTSIKSDKGKTMDNKTWEAFNHEKYPYITFVLTRNEFNVTGNKVTATGTLTMAGITKPIDVTLTYKILASGELQVTGNKTLRMTDFKMEPPTAMMGTIKVGDEVNIDFDFILTLNNNL